MPVRFKVLIILALTILAIFTVYPPEEKINLGLDLKGGIDLTYEIDVEKLKSLTLENEAESIKVQLDRDNVVGAKMQTGKSSVTFTIDDQDQKNMNIAKVHFQSGERFKFFKQSSNVWRMTINEEGIQKIVKNASNKAVEIIRNRIDQIGVKEPIITPQGINRIRIQLPGESDLSKAQDIIGSTAMLEFRIVKGMAPTLSAVCADDEIILPGDKLKDGGSIPYYKLTDKIFLTGRTLTSADPSFDGMGKIGISFSLNSEGAEKFWTITREHVGEQLAIVLDGMVKSAPMIQEAIPGGHGQITGNFTDEEANKLAIILRSGSLPAPIRKAGGSLIGPSLGQDSINKGVKAAIFGSVLVFIFMIVLYKKSGIIADLALTLNILFLMACLGMLDATLTLPGIAGIVLTLGMAVDANVLIFERIKEELSIGKTVRAAIEAGFDRAFITIWDANITTLITALALYFYGTGPVKGFATTLSIGIVISMFTAVFVTKVILDLVVGDRKLTTLSI